MLRNQLQARISSSSLTKVVVARRISLKSVQRHWLHTTRRSQNDQDDDGRQKFVARDTERAEDDVDVCIVGAGPAGLSAAIRLKQLEQERNASGQGDGEELRVVILEKGSEVGTSLNRPKSCVWDPCSPPLTAVCGISKFLLTTRICRCAYAIWCGD